MTLSLSDLGITARDVGLRAASTGHPIRLLCMLEDPKEAGDLQTAISALRERVACDGIAEVRAVGVEDAAERQMWNEVLSGYSVLWEKVDAKLKEQV